MEDQVFKALAVGAPYINVVGIGRPAMTILAKEALGLRSYEDMAKDSLKLF